MIQYQCDGCQAILQHPESQVGQMEKCPMCGHVYRIPPPRRKKPWILLGCVGLGAVLAVGIVLALWPKGEAPQRPDDDADGTLARAPAPAAPLRPPAPPATRPATDDGKTPPAIAAKPPDDKKAQTQPAVRPPAKPPAAQSAPATKPRPPATTQPGPPAPAPMPWQGSFFAFARELDAVLGRGTVPRWDGRYGLRDRQGRTMVVFNFPPAPGSCQDVVNRAFAGRRVEWLLAVDKVAKGPRGPVVRFRTGGLRGNPQTAAIAEKLILLQASLPEGGVPALVTPGARVRLRGVLRSPTKEDLLGGVKVAHGHGPLRGKMRVSVTVYDVSLSPAKGKAARPEDEALLDTVVTTWDVPGWKEGDLRDDHPMRKCCPVLKRFQSAKAKALAGVEFGPKVSGTDDPRYVRFRDRHFEAFEAGVAGDKSVKGCTRTRNTFGGVAYDRIISLRAGKGATAMVAVKDGRCVAYWFMGDNACFGAFVKALPKAKAQ